jgi:hypothetical protein
VADAQEQIGMIPASISTARLAEETPCSGDDDNRIEEDRDAADGNILSVMNRGGREP